MKQLFNPSAITPEISTLLEQNLKGLRRSNGRLAKQVSNIKKTVKDYNLISQSSRPNQRLEYFEHQFQYENSQYIRLKSGRKFNKTTRGLILLQHQIQQFIAEFLGIPQTNYVLYYTDDSDGQIRRVEITPDSQLENVIYSQNRARMIQLDKEAKIQLNNSKRALIITEHFNLYEQAVLQQKAIHEYTKKHNRGHIAEAFERHMQFRKHTIQDNTVSLGQDWTTEEIWQNFKASLGNTAWWRSGDVKNKQVKFLGSSGSVRTGSLTSLQELLNYIYWLAELPPLDRSSPEWNNIVYSIAKAFTDSQALDEYTENSLAKLLAELSNKP